MRTLAMLGTVAALGGAGCAPTGGVRGLSARASAAPAVATITCHASGEPRPVDDGFPGTPVRVAVTGGGTFEAVLKNDADRCLRVSLGLYGSPRARGQVACDDVSPTEPVVAASTGGERAPALASLQAEGFFLTWVDGTSVRGIPLARGAEVAGAPVDLSPAGIREIGRPSVAFTSGGEGMVVYSALTSGGRRAFATPVACSPSWAFEALGRARHGPYARSL